MPRILVTDDEEDIRRLICRYAEHEGYETVGAANGAEAVEACRKEDFDVIVMDIMMPEMDGFAATRQIHEFKDIPVLMLSARGAEYDKLTGFEVGADDYVTKPFSPKELMARLNVIIKRHAKDAAGTEKKTVLMEFGGLSIDTQGRVVYLDGKPTELTAKEFDLLLYLAQHKGVVMSREQILKSVWGYEYFSYDRTVDWQMKLLRSKLGKYRDLIRTIRGVGYKFDA